MKKKFVCLSFLFLSIYAMGRLYFHLTGGFTIAHISSDFPFQPQWELTEQPQLTQAIEQPYYYLGKGCQSYVFLSEDKRYVIKFFKYQRYRLPFWLTYFPPLPAIVTYCQEKKEKKWIKLNGFILSWKKAFEELRNESALLFVHLNKTKDLKRQLTLYDKIGNKNVIDLDQMEFCLQERADLLCDTLLKFKKEENLPAAQYLIHQLLELIVLESSRGLFDMDPALMQNTGVVNGRPIHIDVGQIVYDENIKESTFFHQFLFNKTHRFKGWLEEHYPDLLPYLENELLQIIGPNYKNLKSTLKKK